MTISNDSSLCNPGQQDGKERARPFKHIDLVVDSHTLQGLARLNERDQDELVQELSSIDILVEELITCYDRLVEEAVEGTDGLQVGPLICHYLILHGAEEFLSDDAPAWQFVKEVGLVAYAVENDLTHALHDVLRNAAHSVRHSMPWAVIVQVKEQNEVDVGNVPLPVLLTLIFLLCALLFVLLAEVAAEQCEDLALGLVI